MRPIDGKLKDSGRADKEGLAGMDESELLRAFCKIVRQSYRFTTIVLQSAAASCACIGNAIMSLKCFGRIFKVVTNRSGKTACRKGSARARIVAQ